MHAVDISAAETGSVCSGWVRSAGIGDGIARKHYDRAVCDFIEVHGMLPVSAEPTNRNGLSALRFCFDNYFEVSDESELASEDSEDEGLPVTDL